MKRNDLKNVSKGFINRAKGLLDGPRRLASGGRGELREPRLHMDGQDTQYHECKNSILSILFIDVYTMQRATNANATVWCEIRVLPHIW
jgi:hypothetical protein